MNSFSKMLLLLLFMSCSSAFGQEEATLQNKGDSTLFGSSNYIAKTGYNIAPLPEFMIDPFVGLYLGVYTTIFDYGDGKKFPNYYRSLNISAAYGTKGKTNFGLKYVNYGDMILNASVSYTKTSFFPFYGYNGYQTVYNRDFHNKSSEEYITSPFYNYEQNIARAYAFIQDTIQGTFFNWQVGFDVGHFSTGRVDFNKINKGENESKLTPDVPTLYDRYVDWGIISDDEKDGGWANALRAALIYDTRDRITNPMKGVQSDLTLRYTPSFLGSPKSGLQISVSHRHYVTLLKDRISFAYRLRYDATFGNTPFYAKQILADGIQGFGGEETLWGIHKNRISANQFAMGNFELRAKFARFSLIKQNWYLAAVPLFHSGYMIEPIKIDLSQVSNEDKEKFFQETDNKWYNSYGFGVKIVMNENVVIGFDWAHAINKEAGADAIYVGFGYTF